VAGAAGRLTTPSLYVLRAYQACRAGLPAATCSWCVPRALHARLRTRPKTQS